MAPHLNTSRRRQNVLHITTSSVRASSNRLDASYFCGKSAQTRDILATKATKPDRLGDIARVTQPTVFGKRFMQGTPEQGIPLYASGELLSYQPTTDAYIAKRHASVIAELLAQPGTLLFTRSGSVGRVVLTPPYLAGTAIQDDVIKVVPENRGLANYLYIYFSSPIGQPLLADAAFGSVIQHIKVDHIQELPVYRCSTSTEGQISNLVEQSQRARAEASNLLQSANELCSAYNALPSLDRSAQWIKNDNRHTCFNLSLSEALRSPSPCPELRLEAHFHNPFARAAAAGIQRSPSEKLTIADLTERVFFCNRFTRTFVDADHGIPYLAGKNIVQIRPRIEHYLSISQTEEMNDYKLQKGWILITCSGTVGRTCFVWDNFEKYVATHDLIRVIPNASKVDPGYLYSFLSSPYGYEQILRFRHGSVIDHITPDQVQKVIIPLPDPGKQKEIGSIARMAYEKRAEALKLEDQAQEILLREIQQNSAKAN